MRQIIHLKIRWRNASRPTPSIINNSSADRHSLVDEADPLTDLDVVRLAHVAHDLLEVRADKVAVDALDGADAVGPAHVPPVLLALARHVGAQGAPHARLRGDRVDLGNNRIFGIPHPQFLPILTPQLSVGKY